jgi:hypothetical protein
MSFFFTNLSPICYQTQSCTSDFYVIKVTFFLETQVLSIIKLKSCTCDFKFDIPAGEDGIVRGTLDFGRMDLGRISILSQTGFWQNGFWQKGFWQNGFRHNVLWQKNFLKHLDSGRIDLGRIYFGRITF